MELTKTDSKMLQGLSVLAMVWLHLFDRDYTDLFTPILFGGGDIRIASTLHNCPTFVYLALHSSAAMPI